MTPRPVRRVPEVPTEELEAVLWRLLGTAHRDGAHALAQLLDDAAAAFAASTEPVWTVWRHAVAARQRLIDDDAGAVHPEVSAAREALEKCSPSADTALAMAYLAHIEVTADHAEGAMLLAVDASLLTESPAAGGPSRALQEAHRWLSLALSGLDLEELALGHAVRGQHVAAALRDPERLWRMRLLAARQNVELAQTELRRGDADRAARTGRRGDRVGHLGPGHPVRARSQRRRPARRRPGVGAGLLRRPRRRPRAAAAGPPARAGHPAACGCAPTPTSSSPGCSPGWPSATTTASRARSPSACWSTPRAPSWPPATAAATASACSSSAATRPPWAAPPRRCTGWSPTAPTPAARTRAAASCGRRCSCAAAGCARPSGRPRCCAGTRSRTRSPGWATGAARSAGWAPSGWARSRCRWPSSTWTGSSRSTTPPRTPRATPSCGGSPTCCASTAAPATRSTAGPATSSWSCCRRRPRRRPSSSWSGSAPPWPTPTGATSSSPSRSPCPSASPPPRPPARTRRRTGSRRRLADPVRHRRPAPVLGQARRPQPGPRAGRRNRTKTLMTEVRRPPVRSA